ncbi:phytoene/squalene synthase family protein [Phenylobacterium sp.]|jgi:phytoene synthase|uniref:phytoene/squalene synthase family protein n=1 Tax=Phenylobacterium sp. TaxID=1871053 RepID=UPI003784211D
MDAVVAHSEAAISKGSSSFSAASRLFGRELREDVWQLYAWCRHCDDEIDGQDGGGASRPLSAADRQARLDRLRRLTHAALAGEPMADPAFAAFARVARKHRMAEQWPLELLDGFAQDVEAPRLASQAETLAYCWGVAGTVGVMMATIMGAGGHAVLQRAQDLGLAFQLSNICRDVFEDAHNGRIYLPADQLEAEGVAATPAVLLDRANREAVFRVVVRQLALAETYYDSARVGLRALPFRAALAVAAARNIYREIGRRILRQGPSALSARMRVPKPVMAVLAVRGAGAAILSRFEQPDAAPPRPQLWSRL